MALDLAVFAALLGFPVRVFHPERTNISHGFANGREVRWSAVGTVCDCGLSEQGWHFPSARGWEF
jgi:hypothetical protein